MVSLRQSVLVFLSVVTCAFSAQAQTYPQRPIRVIVPAAAGGGLDVIGRSIAESMSGILGQQLVIENVGGGGGMIGAGQVARAEPDGYTILLHQPGLAAGATLYPKLNFKVDKDLVGVGLVSVGPLMIVGRSSLPARDIRELKEWAIKTDHRLTFGHPGAGSTGHFCGALMKQALGAPVDLVGYRGAGPAIADVIAGHIDLTCVAVNYGVEQAKAGTLKGFGVTSREISPAAPNMEALAVRYPELDLPFWLALFAPSGTPRPIIDTLNGALQKSLADPKVLKTFELSGMAAFPENQRKPEAAMELLVREIPRLGEIIRVNKIGVGQ